VAYASLHVAIDSTPPLSFLQAGCPSCRPTNSVKALKAQRWPQSGRKKFPEFSRLFQSHKLTFPQVIATKSKCNSDLYQGSFHSNSSNIRVPSILADIYWARSLLHEIVMIPFTQSTDALHENLNDEIKLLCLLQFFPEVAQNSQRIPRVFHVQRNPRVFQVFQVCGHPASSSSPFPFTDAACRIVCGTGHT